MTSKLGKDVFIALAAIAWADGKIDPDEATALSRAAREEGLSASDIAAVDGAVAKKVELTLLDTTEMSTHDRLFVYGMAYWITRIDGEMTEAEDAVLTALGKRLRLTDQARMGTEAVVDEVCAMPEGDRPTHYDLRRLRDLIDERIDHLPL